MKHLLLALVFTTTSLRAADIDIYLVAGQSNGWRLSLLAAEPGEAGRQVSYFGMGCTSRPTTATLKQIDRLHPKISGSGLAGALLKHSGKDIAFIQYCVCGSSLNDTINWQPGEDPVNGRANEAGLYASMKTYVADARRQLEALGLTGKIKAVFWHQGEADVKVGREKHEKNLRHLFARFRQDFGADLPIIAGHIRPLDAASVAINQALDAQADKRTKIVPVDGLDFESLTNVHIKPLSCIELGARMVRALQDIEAGR